MNMNQVLTGSEKLKAIVTYEGDITAKLKACGTQCPFHLNAQGNTEQEVTVFAGAGAKGALLSQFMPAARAWLMDGCRPNGRILESHWFLNGESLPLPDQN